MSSREDFYAALLRLPEGRVVSYGDAGRLVTPRVSGLVAGRWLEKLPSIDAAPWWRVVGADRTLKIARKSPEGALEQRRRLEAEGIVFEDDLVPAGRFLSLDELSLLS